MNEPRYPFVAVDVAAEMADELSAALFELGARGVEERDDQTLARGPGEGRVTLVGSFDDRAAAEQALSDLRALDPTLEPRVEEVVGDAWRDAWKEHFAPFALTSTITITPPWIEYAKTRDGEHVLTLEPGRAFGTGLHASTALCAELLHKKRATLAGARVLDVGTGSGILALCALVYGAESAVAIDIDPDVVEVVIENAARNGLRERIVARQGTVQSVSEPFPWVLANIEARVLGPIADDLARVLAPQGILVISGVLAAEHDAMVDRFTHLARPLGHTDTVRRGAGKDDWVGIAFAAKS